MKIKPIPFLDADEREILESLLKKRQPCRVLEWGGGGSTLYWPKRFPNTDWWTVEHDPRWAKALSSRLPPNVTLLHLPFPAYYELERKTVGIFGFIIVDGWSGPGARARCMSRARSLLEPDGVVVLHDYATANNKAGWVYYQEMKVLRLPGQNGARGLAMFSGAKAE